jgi:hypothetical protein
MIKKTKTANAKAFNTTDRTLPGLFPRGDLKKQKE